MGGLRPEVMPEKAAMESGAATGQTTGRDGTPPAPRSAPFARSPAKPTHQSVTSPAITADLPRTFRYPAAAPHIPLWPGQITGNLLADRDDPRGLREDLRPHVLPTAVGFLIALAVHLTE
jgi:hypothetical protein